MLRFQNFSLDRQTDGRTDGQNQSLNPPSAYAARGNNMHPLAWPLLLRGLANTLFRPHCVYPLNLFVLHSYLKYLGSFYGSVSWSSPYHAAFATRTIETIPSNAHHRNNRYGSHVRGARVQSDSRNRPCQFVWCSSPSIIGTGSHPRPAWRGAVSGTRTEL